MIVASPSVLILNESYYNSKYYPIQINGITHIRHYINEATICNLKILNYNIGSNIITCPECKALYIAYKHQ